MVEFESEFYLLVVKGNLPDISEMSKKKRSVSFHRLAASVIVGISCISSHTLTLELSFRVDTHLWADPWFKALIDVCKGKVDMVSSRVS